MRTARRSMGGGCAGMRHYSREEAFFSVSAISCASAAGSASGWRSVARGRLIRTSCIRRPVDKKLFVIDWVESLHRCPAWSSYPAGMEVHCSAMPLLPPDTSPGIDGKRRGLAFDLGIKLADNRGRAPGGADSALLRRSAGGAGVVVNLPPGRREVSSGCFGSSRIRRDLDRAVAATLTWEVRMDPALWIELIVFVVLLGFRGSSQAPKPRCSL
jgi:hypothetical protein